MARIGRTRIVGGVHVDREVMQEATFAVFRGLMWSPDKEDTMEALSRADMPHQKSLLHAEVESKRRKRH